MGPRRERAPICPDPRPPTSPPLGADAAPGAVCSALLTDATAEFARPRPCPYKPDRRSRKGECVARTFTNRYTDQRVKRPDFALAEAIGWFLADYASEVEASTLRTYG